MAKLDQTWTVEAHHGGSALAAELHRAMGVSHRQAKGLIDARCVTVNGEIATKHGQRVEAGDTVAAAFDPALKYDPIPSPKGALDNNFTTLWEDTHLLFVDKPAGLLTVPAEQGGEPSLADAVSDHYRRRGMKHAQLYIVHRLDRFTSGVLVFARTPESLHHLKKLFALHKLQRTYRAILVGELPENQGTLKGHLIEQAKTLKMRVVDPKRKDTEGSQSAVTHYRVVERLPGHTVVEVELETGRRNQIRVQFADRGFPLLGDHVYGEESPLLDRQALHAEVLGIKHPVTEQMVLVTAPLPKDFEAALKALRAKTRLVRAAAGEKGEAPKAVKPARPAKPSFEGKAGKPGPKKPMGARSDRGPSRGRPDARPDARLGDRPRKPFAAPGKDRGKDREEGRREGRSEDNRREGARREGPRGPQRDRERGPRREDGDRPRSPRPKPRFEDTPDRAPDRAPDRSAKPRRPFTRETPTGDRQARPRRESGSVSGPRGARPERPGHPSRTERPERPERPSRPSDRPRGASGPRSHAKPGARPSGPRPEGSRPAGPRPSGPRSSGSKPTGSRPGAPRKPFGKKRG